jgi:2-iminobutanoate/2-iminopropanoate deaminase
MELHAAVITIALALSLLASAASNDRQYINVNPAAANPSFSDAVLVNGTLYVSGKLSLDAKAPKAGASAEEEARFAMDSLKRTVEAAGMTMDDVVSVQVFASDMNTYAAFNSVYRTYFHGQLPARAFVAVAGLVGGARYEVAGVAVRRSK